MPLFKYKAYDKKGVEKSGVIEATEIGAARSSIKKLGLVPFEVEKDLGTEPGAIGRKSLSLSEQARFSRQLAALLKGGVPLTKGLSAIENQKAWEKWRPVLIGLREEVERGKDLSEAFLSSKAFFSPNLISIVRVGETTGRLDFAFKQLAAHIEREVEHRRRFISAISYPAITVIISIGVLSFLMVYLVPTVAKMFGDVKGELPFITQLIILVSDFMRKYWLIIGITGLISVVSFRFALMVKGFKRSWERFQLKIPIWGKFIEGMRMEAWIRNTGTMVQCGVSLLETIKVMRENETSVLHAEALDKVHSDLERGLAFSTALKEADYFPLFLIQMIEAGEASGELPEMMFSVATELEAENKTVTELFLNILEPLLIVVMGTIVGTIMIGVLLPIYEMNKFL